MKRLSSDIINDTDFFKNTKKRKYDFDLESCSPNRIPILIGTNEFIPIERQQTEKQVFLEFPRSKDHYETPYLKLQINSKTPFMCDLCISIIMHYDSEFHPLGPYIYAGKTKLSHCFYFVNGEVIKGCNGDGRYYIRKEEINTLKILNDSKFSNIFFLNRGESGLSTSRRAWTSGIFLPSVGFLKDKDFRYSGRLYIKIEYYNQDEKKEDFYRYILMRDILQNDTLSLIFKEYIIPSISNKEFNVGFISEGMNYTHDGDDYKEDMRWDLQPKDWKQMYSSKFIRNDDDFLLR